MSETLTTETIEFEEYLKTEFGVDNPEARELIALLFCYEAIKSIRELGLLNHWNPLEAARIRLIEGGLPEPQNQYPFLGQQDQPNETPPALPY